MPINHDMMHAQTRPMFEKAGEVLDGVAKLKERVAELENENRQLKEKCERRARTAKMWKNKYEERLK